MSQSAAIPHHPLDALSGEELTRAVALLRDSGKIDETAYFACAIPVEPPKELVANYATGTPFNRAVRLIGHDPVEKRSFDACVSVSSGVLESFVWAGAGQAPVGLGDLRPFFKILFENPEWIAALQKRGVEDLPKVHVDPWVTAFQPEGMSPDGRIFCAIAFIHEDIADNHYARPVEGLGEIRYFDATLLNAVCSTTTSKLQYF